MNEQEFIAALQKGDDQAFKTLVHTWQDMVFNTVLSIVQDTGEAADIAQEVFIQVYRSVQAFRGDSKLSTWLYRIAVTRAIDAERKRKTRKRLAAVRSWVGLDEKQDNPPYFHHPGVQLDNKEKAAVLFRAMKRLPDMQRAAFVLIKTEGLSYEETAAVLQTSLKAVEALVHRAKDNLRKQLANYYRNT
ncbi:RNA polymerase sigma factor [Sediminibacterium soli]|uniref:RNA polymerase sigma factor n=1 Tax=Sediminibacterium soli TaxID=2698829 RepID=UPI00192A3A7E|nr:sigma-70 family RNA polymerase sigma factor [Sediminibacterium soli]